MADILWKYELRKEQVEYLLKALDTVQLRGEAQAISFLKMTTIFRSPLNAKEIEIEARAKEKEAAEKANLPVEEAS